MIKKCYFYCSYNDSPCGYTIKKLVKTQENYGKWILKAINESDKKYVNHLHHSYGDGELFGDESEYIFIVRRVHKFGFTNKDKMISVMFCGNDKNEISRLALFFLCKTEEFCREIYESVIICQCDNIGFSYDIDKNKLMCLIDKVNTLEVKAKISSFEKIISYFVDLHDLNVVEYYLNRNPDYWRYKNNMVMCIDKNSNAVSSNHFLKNILKRKTLILDSSEIKLQ